MGGRMGCFRRDIARRLASGRPVLQKLCKILLAFVVVVVVATIGFYVWASVGSSRIRSQVVETHSVDFPIPFPIAPDEVATLGLSDDAARQLAQQRAVERGKHLVSARYPCVAC